MAPTIPHLSLPLRIVDGHYAAVEQGTTEELQTTVAVICHYSVGFREDNPEFGIPDPELRQLPIDLQGIQAAIEAYEPRAVVALSQAEPDESGNVNLNVAVATRYEDDEEV